MATWMFNPGCCCACHIVVIAIIDEATPYFDFNGGNIYDAEVAFWNADIDTSSNRIHAGLLVPNTLVGFVRPGGTDQDGNPRILPKDTDRAEIPAIAVGHTGNPRITVQDVLDIVEATIGDDEDKPEFYPDVIGFWIDDSGSLTLSMVEQQIQDARAVILQQYPDVYFLPNASDPGERWVGSLNARLAEAESFCELVVRT